MRRGTIRSVVLAGGLAAGSTALAGCGGGAAGAQTTGAGDGANAAGRGATTTTAPAPNPSVPTSAPDPTTTAPSPTSSTSGAGTTAAGPVLIVRAYDGSVGYDGRRPTTIGFSGDGTNVVEHLAWSS